jgi:choline kinase
MQVVHNRYTTHIKDTKNDNITFIVLSAGVGSRMRSYGPKCLFKTSDETILDKQLSMINSNFVGNETILVVGFESRKIIKKIPENIRVVENQLYQTTNSAESLRLAINNSTGDRIFFMHGDLIFNKETLNNLDFSRSFIIVDSKNQIQNDEVGVTVVNDKATFFSYGLDTKWCQMAYIRGKELSILKSLYNKAGKDKLYTFEILNMIIEKKGTLVTVEPKDMYIKEIDSFKDLP